MNKINFSGYFASSVPLKDIGLENDAGEDQPLTWQKVHYEKKHEKETVQGDLYFCHVADAYDDVLKGIIEFMEPEESILSDKNEKYFLNTIRKQYGFKVAASVKMLLSSGIN